jgi:hypothetical protein
MLVDAVTAGGTATSGAVDFRFLFVYIFKYREAQLLVHSIE